MQEQIFTNVLEKLDVSIGRKSSKIQSIDDFKKILNDSGLCLKKVEIIKGVIPSDTSLRAGILAGRGLEPLPFFVNTQKNYEMISNDNAQLVISREFVEQYSMAWIVTEDADSANQTVKSYFGKYRRDLGLIFATAFLINLFGLLLPLFSSFVYDKILGNNIHETLWGMAVCIFFIIGIEFSLRMLRIKASEKLAINTETDIDFSFFRKLLDADLNAMPSMSVMMEKYKQVLSYRDFMSSAYLPAVVDVPFLLLYMAAILVIGGPMVFLLILFGLLMFVFSAIIMRPVLGYDEIAKKESEARFGALSDLINCREIIIGDSNRKFMNERLKTSSVNTALASSKARFWRGFSSSFSNTISYFSFVSVLIAGVYLVENFSLTSGGLLAVSMLTSRAISNIGSVTSLILKYREFTIAKESLDKLLPETKQKHVIENGKLSGHIRVENLSYKPKGSEHSVFSSINLEIRPGEIVGIAGVPGAGKSSLLRMLTGSVTPDKGQILIDNIPVQNLSQKDIASSFGYKPQELCLIEGTIEDNIRMGRPSLNANERAELLHRSGLQFAFSESGLNWQTKIGYRAFNISGGQRQLISLARAFSYNPSILLLDEPTNGLDAELEAFIAKSISDFRGRSTVVVSTHSHHILSICDRIVVVGKGGILANGPREKILLK